MTDEADSGKWGKADFLEALEKTVPPKAVAAAREILTWAEEKGLRLAPQKQAGEYTGFEVALDHKGTAYRLFKLADNGRLQFSAGARYPGWFQQLPPFDARGEELRLKLNGILDHFTGERREKVRQAVRAIAGLSADTRGGQKVQFELEWLADAAALSSFLGVLSWVVDEIRGS